MKTKTVFLISAAIVFGGYVMAILALHVLEDHVMPPERQNAFVNFARPVVPNLPQQDVPVAKEQAELLRGAVVPAANYTLSGPFTHANLAIYLIHGPDQMPGQGVLTLQEALAQNQAVVHAMPAIDNLSKLPLFIQAGDIIKGGTQDRVVPYDMIVPPQGSHVPLTVFCVEAGRSGPRGQEISTSFQSSTEMLPGKRLKLAALHRMSQGDVWNGVRQTQLNLSQNVGAPVQVALSPTSLQLTLENDLVHRAIDGYLQDLSTLPAGKNNVIGCAVAINGQIQCADVYANAGLFKALWPKLLRAGAVDALAELPKGTIAAAQQVGQIQSFLVQAESGQCYRQNMGSNLTGGGRTLVIRQETDQNLLFDTCDQGKQNLVLHRSYLAK